MFVCLFFSYRNNLTENEFVDLLMVQILIRQYEEFEQNLRWNKQNQYQHVNDNVELILGQD